jgi:hypothetical protein
MTSLAPFPALAPARALDVEIVVPVFNEEAALERSVRRLHRFLEAELPFSWRIVVADNATPGRHRRRAWSPIWTSTSRPTCAACCRSSPRCSPATATSRSGRACSTRSATTAGSCARVAAGATGLFLALFAGLYVQMSTDNDPALGAESAQVATTTGDSSPPMTTTAS